MGCHVCISSLETMTFCATQTTKVAIATKRRILWIWLLHTMCFVMTVRFVIRNIWMLFLFATSKSGVPITGFNRKFWTSKHSFLRFKTQWVQTLKLTNRRKGTETKPIWKTCLIYTRVNKNSNSLLQSMKQAVMKNKQNIIGEWHFITIYGLNCGVGALVGIEHTYKDEK